jgi:pilus assembly protein CpaB
MDRRSSLTGWQTFGARVAIRRRLVVAGLTGIAVLSGLNAVKPAPVPTVQVWVAAHDLTGGEPLVAGDLRVESLPRADVPTGAFHVRTAVIGRLLAAPLRRGEPLTDVRILSSSLLAATASPDDVAVPVRLSDGPAALALVHAGDLIDVIAAPDSDNGGPPARFTVVHDVRVLATPTHDATQDDSPDAGDTAGVLIVEATSRQAATLAQAATTARFSIAVHREP